jgi:heterodisulfide reductase subunit A-like polyferredoxin
MLVLNLFRGCVAVCPTEAIQLRGLGDAQVMAMIEAMAR